MVKAKTGVEPDQQRLMVGGQLLQDNRVFANYPELTNQCNIQMVTRLMGGSAGPAAQQPVMEITIKKEKFDEKEEPMVVEVAGEAAGENRDRKDKAVPCKIEGQAITELELDIKEEPVRSKYPKLEFSEESTENHAAGQLIKLNEGAMQLQPLERSKGPCIVSFVCYETSECVVMSCSHVIHPEELAQFAQHEVYNNRKWEIRCFVPSCNELWPLSVIKRCGYWASEASPHG